VKFDPSGNHLWSRQFGSTGTMSAASVATDLSGNILVTGNFSGTVDFGGGPLVSAGGPDAFVTKLDPDGNHVWSLRHGDVYNDLGVGVASDGSGNVLVLGSFSDSEFYTHTFLAKYDAAGNPSWDHDYGPHIYPQCVASDPSGNALITGYFSLTQDLGGPPLVSAGGEDIFIAKFDPLGAHLWSHGFGDADEYADQKGMGIAADAVGNVFLTGYYSGSADFGGGVLAAAGIDVFAAQFDPSGNHVWSQLFGDNNAQDGYTVATDASGGILFAGEFDGSIDFGGGPVVNSAPPGNGSWNVFLAKFQSTPVPVLIQRFDAAADVGTVRLAWSLWSDEAIDRLQIERRQRPESPWVVVNDQSYQIGLESFVDRSVKPATTYDYILVLHTRAGDDIRSPVATATTPVLVASLGQNHPNPFKPGTTIDVTLASRAELLVEVYDARGAQIAVLNQGLREAGTYSVAWDGTDTLGRSVASGVYFYRLAGSPRVESKKMIVVR
ncbi:MAG TPA: SBBP repeat-containing protein, partial [Candidatus Krumholzibacteria bacterium]|nr:SBBP repeat-containing protein [Candidatus Krumholzibacteria bacterium]